MIKRSLVIFYAVVIYAVAELIWWGYQLVSLQPNRIGMILGEGSMFVIVFVFGAYSLHKALNREKKLQEQKKNFLLSVTHELKSPLASIKLLLQTIQKRDLTKQQIQDFIGK